MGHIRLHIHAELWFFFREDTTQSCELWRFSNDDLYGRGWAMHDEPIRRRGTETHLLHDIHILVLPITSCIVFSHRIYYWMDDVSS